MNALHAAAIKAMPEAELEQNVADTCRHLRLRRYHTHRAQHSPSGFPDDVILGPRRMMWRELKRESGKPTAEQVEWMDHLRRLGHDVDIWRPSDWFSGRIVRELQELAGH